MTALAYWNWQHTVEAAIIGTLLFLSLVCLLAIILDARKSRSFRERRRRIAALGRPVPDSRSSQAQFRRIMDTYNDGEHR